MRVTKIYIDTSALAKCYFLEKNSQEVESFLSAKFQQNAKSLVISSLSKLEMDCAINRKLRARLIDESYQQSVINLFAQHVEQAFYTTLRVDDICYEQAKKLIAQTQYPLRSLDALHLAIARHANIAELITADKVMADTARELNFTVHYFE
jgi:predicted nucleic acid-binding protein